MRGYIVYIKTIYDKLLLIYRGVATMISRRCSAESEQKLFFTKCQKLKKI